MVGHRVALIPGGAKGIGRGIAMGLAGRGWHVALSYRSSAKAAEETAELVRAAGGKALAVKADVSEPAAAAELVHCTEEELGPVAALIHCAGPYARVPILEQTPEAWREMFSANVDSLFFCARAVAPGMIARGWGRILGFGIVNAERLGAQPELTAHFAAKAAVIVLIRSLARALAPHGVTANVISPGYIDSGGTTPEELQRAVKAIPAGYVGKVSDVVHASLYFLSDEARYVTGTNLTIAGGWGL